MSIVSVSKIVKVVDFRGVEANNQLLASTTPCSGCLILMVDRWNPNDRLLGLSILVPVPSSFAIINCSIDS